MVSSAALNGRGDNFSRILFSVVLGLLLNFAQLDGCVVLCLLLDGIDKILLGFIAGQTGNAFQTFQLLLLVLLRFLTAFLDVCQTAGQFLVFLVRCIRLTIQRFFLLCQSTFGLGHFAAAFFDFSLKIGAVLVNFFFCF